MKSLPTLGFVLSLALGLLVAGCGGDPEKPQQQTQQKQTPAQTFDAAQIKAAMRDHIAKRTQFGSPGVFEITDPRTSENLKLDFIKIHDPVRSLGGKRYFACTDFHTIGEPDKIFDLDFWLMEFNGELVVYEENVHKLPTREDGEWVKQERYNFVDNQINLLR